MIHAGWCAMRGLQFRIPMWRAALLSLVFLAAPGCFTYSSYQSARIVERGEPQVTFALSNSNIEGENAEAGGWLAFETCLRSGIAKRFDASAMLSIFQSVPENFGAAVVTVDVRGGIIENYLAFTFPVAITMGDLYLASLRVQPGFVATVPLGTRFEITGAARAHTFVRVPELFAMGYNVGLGIRTESGRLMVRPEVGWMKFREAENGQGYFQYGLGLEFGSPRPRTDKERGS